MRDFLAVTRALADPNRLRILGALRRAELCVCQVTALLGLAPSTVSKHLAVLQQARLVESRKNERWVYYRLAGAAAPVVVREALDWTTRALGRDEQFVADARRLRLLRKQDPKVLCQHRTRS